MRNGILIVCNNEDVSDFLERNSLDKNEALNNNKNTCGFTLFNKRLTEQDEVVIYDYIQNIVPITSGQNFMYVNDTYQFEEKYTVGSTIFVDILGKNLKMVIQAVDQDTKKIIFTTNFTSDYPVKAYHGTIFFGGEIDHVNEKRLSKTSDDIRYDYSLIAYEKLMDRKVVIDSYVSQYLREIIGRIVYKFIPTDKALDVFTFESSLTGTGLCSNTTNYTTEKISGNNSQKGICTGNGSRSTTVSSLNLSIYKHLRFWWKIAVGQGNTISKLSLRIGTNSSNYFEYTITHVGNDREDCWLFENVELLYPTATVGSPTLTNITWLSFAIESTGTNYVLFDTMFASTGGITMGPCKRGTRKLDDVRFKGIQPSMVIETLTKSFDHYRYVDYNKAIHYYYQDGEISSSFQITPTEKKYNSLQVKVDTTQIINRQLVEGSEAPAEAIYIQQTKADGVQTSYTLDFKAAGERKYPDGSVKQGMKVFVNNVEKTVGLDGLVVESSVDFVYSFNDKNVRNASYPTLANTDTIKFTYYPYKTISVRYNDSSSVNFMKALVGGDGIFDGKIIIDKTIESIQIARQRAIVEVQTKKDPIVTYDFTTDIAGIGLGQMVYVNDPDKSVDGYFQVQKIAVKSIAGNMFSYNVSITKKFFDYVEFFQLLLKKASNFQINQNVQIIIPGNVDETIYIQEAYTILSVSDFYRAGMIYNKFRNFEDMTGSAGVAGYIGDKNQHWLLEGTGTATVQTVSNYTKTKALELVTVSNNSAKVRTILTKISNNLAIKVGIDTKVVSQSGTGNIKVFVNEYDLNGLLVLAHETTIDKTLPDFVDYLIEFITQNNTDYYSIGVSIEAHTADIYLGNITIQDQTTDTVVNPAVANFSFAS